MKITLQKEEVRKAILVHIFATTGLRISEEEAVFDFTYEFGEDTPKIEVEIVK
ncbi:hypothetical protein AAYR26_00345 (plasmid) [Bacillus licheniformis]|uniref:hypothetical protein n=1 Tax=Bacillus licheniformis TaxID=1402 RepID=UPI0031F4BD70